MSYDAHPLHVAHTWNMDVSSCPPDLIILQLSDTDTLCFCEQLRTLPLFRKVPILALSDTQSGNCAAHALDSGCDDFMCQPVVDRILAARVRALLRRKTHLQHKDRLVLNSQTRQDA